MYRTIPLLHHVKIGATDIRIMHYSEGLRVEVIGGVNDVSVNILPHSAKLHKCASALQCTGVAGRFLIGNTNNQMCMYFNIAMNTIVVMF